MNFKNIPKKLYLYWDGENKLSFLQYLTIKSFREFNPDWEITIYLPQIRCNKITWNTNEQKVAYIGKNYFDKLKDLDVNLVKINFETIGFKNDVPEVIKSDYLRYYLLGNYGGCWCDFDILFIKSFIDIDISQNIIYGNKDEIDTVWTYSGTYIPIGFLMSSKNNQIFLNLSHHCKNISNFNEYQVLGRYLVEKIYPNIATMNSKHPDTNILVLPLNSYLPCECTQINEIFYKNKPNRITKNTFGIHWFNGATISKDFQNLMDQNKHPKSGLIYKYLEKYNI